MRTKFQMRLPDEIIKALRDLAEEQNTTVTRVILKMIVKELKNQRMLISEE